MKNLKIILITILFMWAGISGASGASYLYDWAYNEDGTTYEALLGDSMPTSGTLDSEGLGTLTWTTSAAGNHNFIAFFDHEIDEVDNTFFNEYGSTGGGSLAAGQSWEIDEPGYVFGDIYDNVFNGALDNSNSVPAGSPDDVSMAMGWDFLLGAGENATVSLILGDTEPGSGFWLAQTDPDSGDETIYFSSSLSITGGGPAPIPEPTTLLLVGIGMVGIAGFGRKKFMKLS